MKHKALATVFALCAVMNNATAGETMTDEDFQLIGTLYYLAPHSLDCASTYLGSDGTLPKQSNIAKALTNKSVTDCIAITQKSVPTRLEMLEKEAITNSSLANIRAYQDAQHRVFELASLVANTQTMSPDGEE